MESKKNQIQTQAGTQLVNFTKKESEILKRFSGRKISDEDSVNITLFMKKLFVLLGLSSINTPTQQQFDMLRAAMVSVLGDFTLSEILYAVDLALKGEIEYDLNLYNKPFSIPFLSGLMNKYKNLRADVIIKNRSLEPGDALSDDEKDKIMDDAIERYIDQYKSGNKPNIMTWHYYDYLEKKGLINLSIDQKGEYMAKAKDISYKKSNNLSREIGLVGSKFERNELIKQITFESSEQTIIRTAKELAFENWVKNK